MGSTGIIASQLPPPPAITARVVRLDLNANAAVRVNDFGALNAAGTALLGTFGLRGEIWYGGHPPGMASDGNLITFGSFMNGDPTTVYWVTFAADRRVASVRYVSAWNNPTGYTVSLLNAANAVLWSRTITASDVAFRAIPGLSGTYHIFEYALTAADGAA
jgi:hypothetical protein